MRLVTITSLLALSGSLAVPMLMDLALAVEIPQVVEGRIEGSDPPLPEPTVESQANSGVVTSGQGPSEGCFILGSPSFSIPFTVDAAGTQPVAVRLFVARGSSDNWKLFDQKKPTAKLKQFQYQADGDGEYWFATRTIDAAGQAHPAGAILPQLKVYVDTTKPAIVLKVDADDHGRVHAAMSVNDATPLKIVQLRYATDAVKVWQTVEMSQYAAGGDIRFTPSEDWKLLSLQLVVSDTAGNQTVINQLVRRPRVATSNASRFAANKSPETLFAQPLQYRLDGEQRVAAEPISGPNAPPMLAPLPRGITQSINPPPSTSSDWTNTVPYSASTGAPGSEVRATAQGQNSTRLRGLPQFGMTPQSTPNANYRGATPSGAGSPLASRPTAVPRATTNSMDFGSQTLPGGFPNSAANRPMGARAQSGIPMPANGAANSGAANSVAKMDFAPPSVRGAAPVAASPQQPQSILPPPATPMQIGDGFGLNSPQRSSQELTAKKEKPKPMTAAEAMRPITEESAVAKLKQEEIPAPKAQSDAGRYRSDRAEAVDSNLAMQRAAVRFSDSQRFSLGYELEAVGSQGVEAIELYGSLDHGSTWSLWGQDPDRSSPFDIETQGEGVFGFRIVVVGGNGLASPRPLAGESPDMFVVVDRTRPSVRITGARYGEGDRTGGLVIGYECNDTNPLRRPIMLSFSGSPDGPWTTIAAGLQNTGEYVWRADPNLPRQLYLRIDGTDEAGNVGSYILDQPIDTQGLAPRARIRGFQPLSVNPAQSDGQTALRSDDSFSDGSLK